MGTETWTEVKKGILKIWYKNHFNLGRNLKNLICRNKSKLLSNSFSGIYQLDCTWNALYISETKKKVVIKTIEHQQNSFNGNWESLDATEYCLESYAQFNMTKMKTLSTEQQYHRQKIRES